MEVLVLAGMRLVHLQYHVHHTRPGLRCPHCRDRGSEHDIPFMRKLLHPGRFTPP